jgi:aspartate-semialdehyde dehydrogenase
MKNIAIIGATGVVGQEMIQCLFDRKFPLGDVRLVASERSAGNVVETPFGTKAIVALNKEAFEGIDIALFSAGGRVSEVWAPVAVEAGCLVIDNSSHFRYQEDVPLVIPEINPQVAKTHTGIIASPNCTTAIASIPLWIVHKHFGLKKVIMSTYQATSGAGKAGMDELLKQTKQFAEGKDITHTAFAHQILFNIIPHIDQFQENGYTKEEMKVSWEMKKIFAVPDLLVSGTAVRIPTLRAHSEAITIKTENPIDRGEVRSLLEQTSGVKVVDDPEHNQYPMPLEATGKYDVQVGRIRQSLVFGDHGLDFFVSGDQLLKGAALNAVQIAELFI